MKKSNLIIIIVIVILGIFGVSTYNGIVDKDEVVKQSWANVESAYQRRADLIPGLVEAVKGYAKHENSTFKEVTEARTKATQMTVNIDDLNEENMKKFQEAQSQLQGSLSRLMAISENYPELKANENFRDLQSQLEGTENRLNEARKNYNKTVKEYNYSVRKFPTNILAGMFGFSPRSEFKADEGTHKAPEIKF